MKYFQYERIFLSYVAADWYSSSIVTSSWRLKAKRQTSIVDNAGLVSRASCTTNLATVQSKKQSKINAEFRLIGELDIQVQTKVKKQTVCQNDLGYDNDMVMRGCKSRFEDKCSIITEDGTTYKIRSASHFRSSAAYLLIQTVAFSQSHRFQFS